VIAGQLAGIPAELLHIGREAVSMGLPGSTIDDIVLCGVPIGTISEVRFRLPVGLDVQFGLPPFLAKALKSQLTSYPAADRETCVLCGICRDSCPPGAITIQNSALSVDNARCIRCWCCRELCPHEPCGQERGAAENADTVLRDKILLLFFVFSAKAGFHGKPVPPPPSWFAPEAFQGQTCISRNDG